MPGMYSPGEYDLAGFSVGAVERGSMLPRKEDIKVGDAVIGVASSGIHSNGYSLVRAVVQRAGLNYKSACPFAPGKSLGMYPHWAYKKKWFYWRNINANIGRYQW